MPIDSYSLTPPEELDFQALKTTFNLVCDFYEDFLDELDRKPELSERINRVFDDLTNLSEQSPLDEAYLTAGLERILDARSSHEAFLAAKAEGKEQQAQAKIWADEILYYDLYFKFCLGDTFNGYAERIPEDMMHDLSPPVLLAAQNKEILEQVGAHNILNILNSPPSNTALKHRFL